MSPEYLYTLKIIAINVKEARKREEFISLIDGVAQISPLFPPQSETLLIHEPTDEYLTAKQAAEYLNKSIRSLYRYVEQGIIHRSQIGKKPYFKLAELKALKQPVRITPY